MDNEEINPKDVIKEKDDSGEDDKEENEKVKEKANDKVTGSGYLCEDCYSNEVPNKWNRWCRECYINFHS